MQKIRVAAVGAVAAGLLASAAPANAVQDQPPQQTQSAQAKAFTKLKVLKEFDYSHSKKYQLPLRLGEYYRNKKGKMVGFGWTKIKKKHNITKYGIVGWLAKSPNIDHLKGPRYNLTGWAHHVKCSGSRCKIVDRRKMLLATDETMTPTGGRGRFAFFGAVTAFCVGTEKCPTWVNTKFKPRMTALNTAASGDQYVFSYKPLKVSKGHLVPAA
ncbi:hypothetical protein ABZ876_27760 [Streptomyces sp. NPDC046931]|uniref:hypothetical protein n=1 Tax=Streptomyces sp. NPDC046931 TaxID=3154806 RepID=UPI0033E32CA6